MTACPATQRARSSSKPASSTSWWASSCAAQRAFAPERLADRVAGYEVNPTPHIDAIRQGGKNPRHQRLAIGAAQPLQRLGNRLGLTGQVDDQAPVADHGHLARQNRGGHEPQADLAHLLAKTR